MATTPAASSGVRLGWLPRADMSGGSDMSEGSDMSGGWAGSLLPPHALWAHLPLSFLCHILAPEG